MLEFKIGVTEKKNKTTRMQFKMDAGDIMHSGMHFWNLEVTPFCSRNDRKKKDLLMSRSGKRV